MNWTALGAISDLIAAIVVIVTLGYLAVQVRQNTAALRSTAAHGAHDQAASIYDELASDPELTDLFMRVSNSPEDANDIERARFTSLMMAAVFRLQNWYLQVDSRTMDPELLHSWSRLVGQHAHTRGFKQFWEQRGNVFAPQFRKYLEEKVFSAEPDPLYRPLGASEVRRKMEK